MKTKSKAGEKIETEGKRAVVRDKAAGEYIIFEGKPVHLAVFPKDYIPKE